MGDGQLPNLVIAQRVIDKMAKGAARFIHDETGEALVGLIHQPRVAGGVPTLYVLDTIAPDEEDVQREAYAFTHGGESQYDHFTWLLENWQADAELRRAAGFKFDEPLAHIGDWHKQPGYMIAPSGGDLASAIALLADAPEIPFWLAPIVTLGHPPTLRDGAAVNYVTVPDGHGRLTRIDFWLIDRRAKAFRPIVPAVYPNSQLPALPAPPWHLADDARLSLEVGQLEHEGWLVSQVVLWDTDLEPPLEVCFMLGRAGGESLLLLATEYDYPASPPRAYAAPFVPLGRDEELYDAFEKAWREADPLPWPDGLKWSPELYLVDYISALMGHAPAGLEPAAPDSGGDEEDDE